MQPIALPSQVLGPDGRRYWEYDGRRVPIMAGAEDPPADPPKNDPPKGDPPKGDDKGDDEPFDKDRALATIRKLRETEKASKTQLKELEELRAKVKADDDAKLSEQDRLKKEADDAKAETARLKTERQELVVQHAVEREAQALGFADPDDALRFLDLGQVELDDAGKPKNVKKLLEEVLDAKPYLKAASDGKGSGGGAPATPRGNREPANKADQVAQARKELQATGGWTI
jgi:hypothetical protein